MTGNSQFSKVFLRRPHLTFRCFSGMGRYYEAIDSQTINFGAQPPRRRNGMNVTSMASNLAVPATSLHMDTGAPFTPKLPSRAAAEMRKRAIEDIYKAYVEQIYKFVFFKLGNREDAEDITSQVFI